MLGLLSGADESVKKPSRRTLDRRALDRRVGRQAGFTLVEVLVVLAIIGLIMSMIGPRVMHYLTDSKYKAARIQVESLASAVELFFLDNGRYPLQSEGLQALVVAPRNLVTWNGPYIKGTVVPLDPWAKPYRYVSDDRGRSFAITFVGPDGRGPDGQKQAQDTTQTRRF
ncbi:MAG: type II secretion system major pseudopilin GspG [Hyphomicrobiales bacterium]|nr:type II secretion system major pseudopilin GspG [Hyphomicrobiales bacterium]